MEQLICNAIRNKMVLKLTYNGSTRTCEPHLLGYDSTDDLTLSAWQTSGSSGTGWRDYHISKASGISTTGKNFVSARPGYSPDDRTIDQVVCAL